MNKTTHTQPAHNPALRSIGANILIAETPFSLLGIEFGNRMTVIRLANDNLLLHSPVRPSPALLDATRDIGTVAWLIAPNLQHNLFSNAWKTHFPEAQIIAPPGVKRITADITAPGHGTLSNHHTGTELEELNHDITIIPIQGIPALQESAFIHHASRTLILTDLAFNIQKPANLWSSFAFKLYGARGKFGPTRLIRALIKDKTALSHSLHTILEYDFDRIIVSHGEIIETDGKMRFTQAFANWL